MPKIASILACCVAVLIFSFETQAFPGSPVPPLGAASQVIPVRGFCPRGYHHRRYDGACVPYVGQQAFGLPYVELPSPRLPYAELSPRLPYVELPPPRLPYVELSPRLPYGELPPPRLPYVELSPRLPYGELPPPRLPYVGLPVIGTRRVCPIGYSYDAPYRRCIPI
jgi:hypothetical protein